jgi:RimJ/RimL family protein N-acetyltransferase
MSLNSINTKRLILLPITREITASLLDKKTNEVEELGLCTDGSWPTADTMDILPIIYETLKESEPSGFETWLIIRKDNNHIIGDIGFHGKPDETGGAEIGYGIVEAERSKGFGFEALQAIVDWAVSQKSVNALKAECLIENTASARILEKAGMCEIRRDKELMYWQIDL